MERDFLWWVINSPSGFLGSMHPPLKLESCSSTSLNSFRNYSNCSGSNILLTWAPKYSQLILGRHTLKTEHTKIHFIFLTADKYAPFKKSVFSFTWVCGWKWYEKSFQLPWLIKHTNNVPHGNNLNVCFATAPWCFAGKRQEGKSEGRLEARSCLRASNSCIWV